MKSIYKIVGIAILLSTATLLQAQIEKTKTFAGEFSDLSELVINHRRGPLDVRKSKDGTTRYEAKVYIKSKDEESAAMMLERMELNEDEFGGKVEISTNFNIENWVTINGKTTVKFKDGTKVKGIREVKIEMVVYVGKLEQLHLENKYDEISIHDDLATNLSVELHSGKLRCVNYSGEVSMDMKYSKADLGNMTDLKMEIYDSDIVMGNASKIQIESKYSSYEMGNLSELKGETYDDNFKIGNITGILALEDKYSEFKMGSFKTGKLEFHDVDFEATSAEGVEIKSKYSEFKFTNVGAIEFESSFDDNLKAEEVNVFSADSKYSEFVFQTIKESATIATSFDDKLEIANLGANFQLLKIDGKYTDLDVDIAAGAPFHLNVDMTYGKVHFDEDSFETQIWKEKEASRKEIVGKSKGATEESGKIMISGFDNTISLK